MVSEGIVKYTSNIDLAALFEILQACLPLLK